MVFLQLNSSRLCSEIIAYFTFLDASKIREKTLMQVALKEVTFVGSNLFFIYSLVPEKKSKAVSILFGCPIALM